VKHLLAAALAAAVLLAVSGCGSADVRDQVEQTRKQVEQRVTHAEREFQRRRDRFGKRIRKVLGDLRKAVPQARSTSPTVRSRGRHEPETIDAFLTDLLKDIDGYWSRTFEAAGLPEPQIRYDWVAPGSQVLTGCGEPAGDRAAFYCPADDTIYVAQQFAADLYRGVARGLPGESAGVGRGRPRGRRLRRRQRPAPRDAGGAPGCAARRISQRRPVRLRALRAEELRGFIT
jgi:Putative neutral zinc metallopeptidase